MDTLRKSLVQNQPTFVLQRRLNQTWIRIALWTGSFSRASLRYAFLPFGPCHKVSILYFCIVPILCLVSKLKWSNKLASLFIAYASCTFLFKCCISHLFGSAKLFTQHHLTIHRITPPWACIFFNLVLPLDKVTPSDSNTCLLELSTRT
jgi:hypothetical protein